MAAMIPANSVHLISGGNVIKQGDETPLTFQLNDESGQPVDLAGATVTVRMANSQIVVLTKQVTVNDDNTVSFAITSDEATGHGEMRLEFVVNKDGKQEIFPAQGFQQITIQPSLGGLDSGYVAVITLEEFERRFSELEERVTTVTDDAETKLTEVRQVTEEATAAAQLASQSAQYADVVGQYANEQGDYAKAQGDIARDESSNLSQLKSDVVSATEFANQAATDAQTATQNANQAAQNATTQANYAKQQGDYAKQQGDIAKGIIESGTVASVNGQTGAVVLSAEDVNAIPATEKGVAGGVAKLNEEGKVVDASGNEVEGKVTSVNGQVGEVNILIPAKVSELENDSGFATAKYVEDEVGEVSNELASHQADYVKHPGYGVATGSANVYEVTLNPAPTAYVEGMAIAVKINVDNTGPSTINVNGLGAKAIKKPNGNDVSAGNLKAGSIYTMRYNGTNFILQGEGSDLSDTDKSNLINSINTIYDM